MKDQLTVLKQTELCGRQFQVYGTADEPLFLAKDVAEVLNLTNVTDMVSRVDEDELAKLNLGSRQGETWFLTENGLYEVLMQSRKPIAKQFKKGVKQILKEVRTKGGYMTVRPDETPEEIMARALMLANDTLARQQERIAQLNAVASRQTLQIEAQEATIREQAPKVAYHDTVLSSESTYTATQIAKEFGWGAQTLNRKLYHLKVQYKLKGQWLLYANHANKGYTRTSTITFLGSDGEPRSRQITEWTEKGRKFIHSLLKEHRLV